MLCLNDAWPGEKISQDSGNRFELTVRELQPVDRTGRPQVKPLRDASLAKRFETKKIVLNRNLNKIEETLKGMKALKVYLMINISTHATIPVN